VRRAVDAVDGLARNGYDLHRWLAANGMELTWRGGLAADRRTST
jgi:predicted RNA-binding protein associated with RNAse of E/G family